MRNIHSQVLSKPGVRWPHFGRAGVALQVAILGGIPDQPLDVVERNRLRPCSPLGERYRTDGLALGTLHNEAVFQAVSKQFSLPPPKPNIPAFVCSGLQMATTRSHSGPCGESQPIP